MRILTISSKYPYPAKDGGALAIKALLENFALLGHKVDFLAISTPKHPAKVFPEKSNIRFYTTFVDTTISPIKAIRNIIFSNKPYVAERFYSKDFAEKLKNLLKRNKYDFVLFEGLYVADYVDIVKKEGLPVIYRAHNVEHIIWERKGKNEKNLWKKLYIKHLAKRLKKYELNLIKQFDAILPITTNDLQLLRKYNIKQPAQVAPFGININEEENNKINIESDNNLAFIGSLDWLPNIEGLWWFLSNVFPEIYKETHIKLYIAGRNAPLSFEKKITNIKGVVYLGEVDDALEFIYKHKIHIVPLLSGSGMRVKVVEAMWHKRLVISSPVGVEGINIIDKEHFLLAQTKDEWINAIIFAFNNIEEINKIAEKGYKKVGQDYNNEKIVKNTIDFIQGIISEKL